MVAIERGARWFGVLVLSAAAACSGGDGGGDVDAAVPDAPAPSCASALPCEAPSLGLLTVCGRLADAATTETIAAADADGTACDPAQPTATGPCSLHIELYDALDFAQDPRNARPLVPGQLFVDTCGRFAARDVPATSFGFLGIAVDDAASVADTHRLTAISIDDTDAAPAQGVTAYATRRASEEAWSAGAGLSPGFADRGVVLMTFRYQGVPRSGVQVRHEAQTMPDDDYYFSDATAARTTIGLAQTETGASGSVLLLGSPTVLAYDGAGNEPSSCAWPNEAAAAIVGVVLVQDRSARAPGGGDCP